MFQRIFVPLDGSKRAEHAIPVAARLARASGGSVTLLRVVTAPIELAWSAMEAPVFMQEVLDMDMARAEEYLAQVAVSPLLKGIDIHVEAVPGLPAPVILSAAQSAHSDLIVLCSHGDT